MRSLPFEPLFSYPFLSHDHITLKEALTVKTLLVSLSGNSSLHRHRVLNIMDSAAAKRAFAKWRSSSWRLNKILKQAAPYQLGAGLYLGCLRGPSEDMPADDLTRGAPLRPPAESSHWLDDVGPDEGMRSFCCEADTCDIENEDRVSALLKELPSSATAAPSSAASSLPPVVAMLLSEVMHVCP